LAAKIIVFPAFNQTENIRNYAFTTGQNNHLMQQIVIIETFIYLLKIDDIHEV